MPFALPFDSVDDDDDERIDGVAWNQRAGGDARYVAHASSPDGCRGSRHPAQGWSRHVIQHRLGDAFEHTASFAFEWLGWRS